MADSFVNEK